MQACMSLYAQGNMSGSSWALVAAKGANPVASASTRFHNYWHQWIPEIAVIQHAFYTVVLIVTTLTQGMTGAFCSNFHLQSKRKVRGVNHAAFTSNSSPQPRSRPLHLHASFIAEMSRALWCSEIINSCFNVHSFLIFLPFHIVPSALASLMSQHVSAYHFTSFHEHFPLHHRNACLSAFHQHSFYLSRKFLCPFTHRSRETLAPKTRSKSATRRHVMHGQSLVDESDAWPIASGWEWGMANR